MALGHCASYSLVATLVLGGGEARPKAGISFPDPSPSACAISNAWRMNNRGFLAGHNWNSEVFVPGCLEGEYHSAVNRDFHFELSIQAPRIHQTACLCTVPARLFALCRSRRHYPALWDRHARALAP